MSSSLFSAKSVVQVKISKKEISIFVRREEFREGGAHMKITQLSKVKLSDKVCSCHFP